MVSASHFTRLCYVVEESNENRVSASNITYRLFLIVLQYGNPGGMDFHCLFGAFRAFSVDIGDIAAEIAAKCYFSSDLLLL